MQEENSRLTHKTKSHLTTTSRTEQK